MLTGGRKQFYRDFWALRNVSFDIRKGETVGIVGRNGSGKSTLLQLICGTLSPTTGSVETRGRIAALLELGSGFNPDFTGRENVYMNAAVLGLTRAEIDARYDKIAAFADIGDFIERPIKTYSSGMIVRLAFAVQAMVDPDILVVDEALAVGDIRFQSKCMRRLKELKSTGTSILFVSHAPGLVEALCDRAIWLESGLMWRDGEPREVTRRYVSYVHHGIAETYHHRHHGNLGVIEPARAVDRHVWEWISTGSAKNVRAAEGCSVPRIRLTIDEAMNPADIPCKQTRLAVEFEIVVDALVDAPLIGIGLFNRFDEPIVHFNSFQIGASHRSILPMTPVVVRAEASLPALQPGEYLLAIGVDDGPMGANRLICHVHDSWTFRVVPPVAGLAQAGYIQVSDAIIRVNS